VNALVRVALSQAQFDALVSFAFSVGEQAFAQSQVLRRVNSGDAVAAACAMDAWRKSDVGGELEVIDVLVRRRAAEKALFLKGSPYDASPSVFMRAKLDHAAMILGAPVTYARAPAVGSVPAASPQALAAERIVEILKSEPATDALLLTQVIAEEAPAEEINTAHAKPVARTLSEGRRALWREEQKRRAEARQRPVWLSFMRGASVETVGLSALMLFGLGLGALGVSTWFGGRGDGVDVMGVAALAGPGLVAAAIAGYGLWRRPKPRAAVA
jgi:hypothetical protein